MKKAPGRKARALFSWNDIIKELRVEITGLEFECGMKNAGENGM